MTWDTPWIQKKCTTWDGDLKCLGKKEYRKQLNGTKKTFTTGRTRRKLWSPFLSQSHLCSSVVPRWQRTWRSLFYLIQPFLQSLQSSGLTELLMYSRYGNHDECRTAVWHKFGRVSALYKLNLLISTFGAIDVDCLKSLEEMFRVKNIYNAIN